MNRQVDPWADRRHDSRGRLLPNLSSHGDHRRRDSTSPPSRGQQVHALSAQAVLLHLAKQLPKPLVPSLAEARPSSQSWSLSRPSVGHVVQGDVPLRSAPDCFSLAPGPLTEKRLQKPAPFLAQASRKNARIPTRRGRPPAAPPASSYWLAIAGSRSCSAGRSSTSRHATASMSEQTTMAITRGNSPPPLSTPTSTTSRDGHHHRIAASKPMLSSRSRASSPPPRPSRLARMSANPADTA